MNRILKFERGNNMKKNIKITLNKEDYKAVMKIVEKYAKGRIDVVSKNTHNEIEFTCSLMNSYICKNKLETAKELGMIIKIEA